jgi:hypothetical protein
MKFYRYQWREYATLDYDGDYFIKNFPDPKITYVTYELIRETPKGYWIGLTGINESFFKKWVSKTSKKRYAYPTKKEALINFKHRTDIRYNILSRQISCLEIVKRKINDLENEIEKRI